MNRRALIVVSMIAASICTVLPSLSVHGQKPAEQKPATAPAVQPGTQTDHAAPETTVDTALHDGEVTTRAAQPAPNGSSEAAAAKTALDKRGKRTGVAAGSTPLDEANGSCRSPRHTWVQLLYWLQVRDRWQPKRAAACFDLTGLSGGREQAAKLAVMLKRVLDAKPTWILTTDIPNDPNYVDEDGLAQYTDPVVARDYDGIVVARSPGGKWLFTPDTLSRIPELYPSITSVVERILPDWMLTSIVGVEAWKFLAILVLVVVATAVTKIVVYVVRNYVRGIIGKTGLHYLDMAVSRADRPIGGLVMAAVFHLGFPMLLFPPGMSRVLTFCTQVLAAYSVVWLAYRLIDVVADVWRAKAEKTDSRLDDQLVPLAIKSLKVVVFVIGSIFILQNLNVNVGSLLAGLGIGGLAFALAAKDTIANLFGSVMIFVDKPFQIGDWVVLSGTEGIVEEVGFRTSRVRTFYNSVVTVPNATVVSSMVDNYGMREYRRYVATLGLTYDTSPDKVQAFCEGVRALIAGMPGMRKDYYLVEFKEFGQSGLEIMVYCFMICRNWNEELRIRTNLNLDIMRLAETLGVSFAFPTQTVHVETLAAAGAKKPQAPAAKPGELSQIIDGFGPGGAIKAGMRPDFTEGYDCGPKWLESSSKPT